MFGIGGDAPRCGSLSIARAVAVAAVAELSAPVAEPVDEVVRVVARPAGHAAVVVADPAAELRVEALQRGQLLRRGLLFPAWKSSTPS